MARNGSGIFSPPGSSYPAVANTLIESAKFNAVIDDISTALSGSIAANGETTITGNIPMSSNKITGLGAATARTDAASLANIQDATGVYAATVGGTVDAITLTPSPAISAYAAGQRFTFIAAGANTGAATVNVSGVGAKSITKNGTTALAAGDIGADALITIQYDGTQFQIQKDSMTAAAILAALLTVDGASSSLDADLLDGAQGSAYAKYADVTANFTGTLQYGGVEVGYRNVPRSSGTGKTLGTSDGGTCYASSGTVTVPTALAAGTTISIYNNSASAISIAEGASVTLRWAGTTSTGNRTLAARGMATVWYNSTTEAIITGSGLT